MDVAYVIGPYRSKQGSQGIKKNIDRAEDLARKMWLLGFAVICPQKNTAFLDGIAPDEVWIRGDLEFLNRSDLAVTVNGWENSTGSKMELDFCKNHNIPIYYSLDEVMERHKKLSSADIAAYKRSFENLP